jgi:RimJ/RimL family protein N-acetyltransferase
MEITLRPFADNDLPQFAAWLREPHVVPWYTPAEDWLHEVENRRGEFAFISHFIVLADGAPIGFCQYYPYWLSGEDWHGAVPVAGTYSIDYMIGNPAFLRRGCGAQAIRLLTRAVFAQPDAARIIVQPDEENAASRGVLAAAGYVLDTDNGVFILRRAD